MTKEQAIFYVSLKKIKALEEQEPKDQKQIDQYKTYLWEVIYKFAKSEINSLMGGIYFQRRTRRCVTKRGPYIF